MQSSGENTNIAVNALLKWSENDIHSGRSALVKIVAITHKLIDKPLEGVDPILSNIDREALGWICLNAASTLQYSIGTKTEKELASHRLLIMCLKRLFQSKVGESEQFMMIDVVDIEDPKELAMLLAKLLICMKDSDTLAVMSRFHLKLAVNCPEYEKDLLDKIYKLIEYEDEGATDAMLACIAATSVLDKRPQDAERTMNKCLQLIRDEGHTNIMRVSDIVSLNVLLETYLECPSDFLAFHITGKLLYTPVTIETRGNGPPQLIMQTTSSNKVKYTFRTDEEAKEFVSLVNLCTEVMYPRVASFVPKLEVPEAQQSKRSFFVKLKNNRGIYKSSASDTDSELASDME